MPTLFEKMKTFFYPPSSSKELKQCVQSDSEKVEFTSKDKQCNSSKQSCPLKDKKQPDNPNCTFTSITANKDGRVFKYEWKKSGGVTKDANRDLRPIYEIIAGDEKPEKVTLQKATGLKGPCPEQHKTKSWDIEALHNLPDASTTINALARKTNFKELSYYLPYDLTPEPYAIGCYTCGALHEFNVLCYPDTELSVDGSFTFFSGESERKDQYYADRSEGKTGKSGELNLELKRNGKQVVKVNLLNYEKTNTHGKREYSGDFNQTATAKNEAAKKDVNKTPSELDVYQQFAAIEEYKERWNRFYEIKDKVLGKLQGSSTKPFSVEITFLKFNGNIAAKWVEIPNSRYCDYEVSGSISLSPLFSMKFDWDFTRLVTNIPYLGTALALTDAFMNAMKIGDLAIKLEVLGSIGLSSDQFTYRHRNIHDPSLKSKKPKLIVSGEIGVTLRAYADGEVHIDHWGLTAGGAAHAEAGIKAKIADTATILSEVSGAMKEDMSPEDQDAFDQKFISPESKQSQLLIINGRLTLVPKIGFSGLVVYSLNYAEASVSVTSYDKEPPTNFTSGENNVSSFKQESSLKHGFSKKWGSEKAKIHKVLWPAPVWDLDVNLLGNS